LFNFVAENTVQDPKTEWVRKTQDLNIQEHIMKLDELAGHENAQQNETSGSR